MKERNETFEDMGEEHKGFFFRARGWILGKAGQAQIRVKGVAGKTGKAEDGTAGSFPAEA